METVAEPQLTSTTAPGKVFANRPALAEHYKSPWHKYNLKRREAGLPPLLEGDFEARLAAAQEALEQQQKSKLTDSHLKKGKKHKQHKNKFQQVENGGNKAMVSSQVPAYDQIKQGQQEVAATASSNDGSSNIDGDNKKEEDAPKLSEEDQMMEDAKEIEIDPRQCLFDRHISANVEDNITRMLRKYGFFIPDQDCLMDKTGLIGYCHEKIKIGRICLYCQKGFSSYHACQKHMVSTLHTKICYEAAVDLEEFAVFYDFETANKEFLMAKPTRDAATANDNEDDGENGEWEDVSDDDEGAKDDEAADDEDEEMYAEYESEVKAMGLDVTPLGELIFPDGRIIGHRSFRRYYKQRAPRTSDSRVSVTAARHAAADRIYQGRIVNLQDANAAAAADSESTAIMAQRAGLKASLLAGGVGKGILVPSKSGGGYKQLSIYRYRAALHKQRVQHDQGQRQFNRTYLNMNRMDKKWNRLGNGVSVAHAKR